MPTIPVVTDPTRVVTRCPVCKRPYATRTLGARGGPKPVCSKPCHDVHVAWEAFREAFDVLLHQRDWHGDRWMKTGALLAWRGKLFALCSTRAWNEGYKLGPKPKTRKAQPLLDAEGLGLKGEEEALVEALRPTSSEG